MGGPGRPRALAAVSRIAPDIVTVRLVRQDRRPCRRSKISAGLPSRTRGRAHSRSLITNSLVTPSPNPGPLPTSRPTCGPDRRQSCRYVGRTELVLWESQIGTTSMRDSRGSYAVVRIWECPVKHRHIGVCEHRFPGLNGPLSRHQAHTTHLLRARRSVYSWLQSPLIGTGCSRCRGPHLSEPP